MRDLVYAMMYNPHEADIALCRKSITKPQPSPSVLFWWVFILSTVAVACVSIVNRDFSCETVSYIILSLFGVGICTLLRHFSPPVKFVRAIQRGNFRIMACRAAEVKWLDYLSGDDSISSHPCVRIQTPNGVKPAIWFDINRETADALKKDCEHPLLLVSDGSEFQILLN